MFVAREEVKDLLILKNILFKTNFEALGLKLSLAWCSSQETAKLISPVLGCDFVHTDFAEQNPCQRLAAAKTLARIACCP